MESFEAIFSEQYETIHRLETNKLRNVARLFAHLLYTDSVPWSVRMESCSSNHSNLNKPQLNKKGNSVF